MTVAFPPRARHLRLLSLFLAIVWMATIYFISSQPGLHSDLGIRGLDKIIHAGAYGLLAGLWLITLPLGANGYPRRHIILAIGIASLYGIVDEWHQSFVPGRVADIWDLAADVAGACIAVWLLSSWAKRRLSLLTDTATSPASRHQTPGSVD